MKGIYISAAHKSSGKTTVSIGLCAALRSQGVLVSPFKKGPDYIDPMWLSLASQRPCYNLDFFTQSREEISRFFSIKSLGCELALVEGNKGLYDGLDTHGSDSNAAMAKHISTPVVLVLDTVGTIRGVAPLVLGYQAFDRDVQIAGIIFNKVGGVRHETKLRQVIEAYTDVPVVGAVHRNEHMALLERHLGLIPSNEEANAREKVEAMGRVIKDSVDLNLFLAKASPIRNLDKIAEGMESSTNIVVNTPLRLAVAKDPAFGFYYADDLDQFRALGVELVYVDMLLDDTLPAKIDGFFIGGGFPESFAAELGSNVAMKQSVAAVIEAGLPVYAECGGLMYLSESIEYQGVSYPMVGLVPGKSVMTPKPKGRGYTRLKAINPDFWGYQREVINAHEFHYSELCEVERTHSFEFDVERGTGINGTHDGYHYKNMLASYTHLRSTDSYRWCEKFCAFMRQVRAQRSVPGSTLSSLEDNRVC